LDELDVLIVGEALASRVEHDLGEVKADAHNLGAITLEECEHTAISRPEVEDATSVGRDMLEQDALPLRAVRESVRSIQIAQDTLGSGPLVSWHTRIIGHYHRPQVARSAGQLTTVSRSSASVI
jgi:hypothetical protein